MLAVYCFIMLDKVVIVFCHRNLAMNKIPNLHLYYYLNKLFEFQ